MIWRVGFVPAASVTAFWWQRLLRPGYVHVWAARRLWRGAWLWVEWTPSQTLIGVLRPDAVRRYCQAASEIVVVDMGEAPDRRRPSPHVLHCVALVADVLGVRVRAWATPWALRCALLRIGGRPLRAGGGVD